MPRISFVRDRVWLERNTLLARFKESGIDPDVIAVCPLGNEYGGFRIVKQKEAFHVIFRIIESPADSFDIVDDSHYISIGSFESEKGAQRALEKIEKALHSGINFKQLLKVAIWILVVFLGIALVAGSAKPTIKTKATESNLSPASVQPLQLTATQAGQQQGVDRRINPKVLPVSQSWKFGNPNGKPVYVFSDPDCPFCKELEGTFSPLGKDYHFMVFPVPLKGLDSLRAIEAIACSPNPPETWHKWMLSGTPFPPLKNEGAECAKLGGMAARGNLETFVSQGFNGTPTIIREDGAVQPGAMSAEDLRAWLEKSK